jgi:protein translocase SecG subunit
MKTFLLIFQIAVSVILIVFILFQQRGAGLGSTFGGDGGFYSTKRGIAKKLHWLTIVLTGLFIIGGIANLLI